MADFIADEYTDKNLDRQKVVELKNLFDILDTERSGYISNKELLSAFQSYKLEEENPEIYKLLESLYTVLKIN